MPKFHKYTDGKKRTKVNIQLQIDEEMWEQLKQLEKLGKNWRVQAWGGAMHEIQVMIDDFINCI